MTRRQAIFAESVYGLYWLATILGYPFLGLIALIHLLVKRLRACCGEKSIVGEVALITGSGGGLGRCIAVELAKRGCLLAIVDVQEELAEETAKYIAQTYNVKTKAYKIDVSNFEQLEDLKTQITNDLGDVTILINNAGILALSSIDNPPAYEVQRMINVNFAASVFTTQIFLPRMKQLNRGHIVNISSMSALMPNHMYAIYCATKAAVRQLTAALRSELMQQNYDITATTLMPTFLNTNKHIVQMMKLIDGYTIGPRLDGEVVVQYLIKAMLNGEDEVTVPRIFLSFYKLVEFLPAYIRENAIAIWTKHNNRKLLTDKVDEVLKDATAKFNNN